MAGRPPLEKPRVFKVRSEPSWDFLTTQAANEGSPVVVHFTASWCMPSVAMHRTFQELALSYQDMLFLSVDVDEVKGIATKMEVNAMPTFVLMRQGAQIDKLVGANPDAIRRRIGSFARSFRGK